MNRLPSDDNRYIMEVEDNGKTGIYLNVGFREGELYISRVHKQDYATVMTGKDWRNLFYDTIDNYIWRPVKQHVEVITNRSHTVTIEFTSILASDHEMAAQLALKSIIDNPDDVVSVRVQSGDDTTTQSVKGRYL